MNENGVETRYDAECGLYVAVAPGDNFCTAFGKTPEEARARLELARSLWFDKDGKPLCGPECLCQHPAG